MNMSSGDQSISIPNNLRKFLYNYNHSRFLECLQNTENFNKKLIEKNEKQNITKNAMIKPYLKYLKDYFESLYKNYWLISGTLLGKNPPVFKKVDKFKLKVFVFFY